MMKKVAKLLSYSYFPGGWTRKRAEIMARVMSLVGESPVEKVSPDPKVVEEVDCETYVRRKITFAVAADERVPAYLLLPKNINEPVPAILCLHGTNAEGKNMPAAAASRGRPGRDYGHRLAQRGYIAFCIDDPVMGERAKGVQGFDTRNFYKKYPEWSVVGKVAWDYRCAVDYLSTLEFVDPSGFGAIGHSLGATNLIFVAALDERVTVAVPSCGWGTFCFGPREYMLSFVGINPGNEYGYNRLGRLREIVLKGEEPPFDFHEVISLIAPRAVLRISAHIDPYVCCPEVIAQQGIEINRIYRFLDKEKNFSQYFHGDGHDFSERTYALVYAWFDEHFSRLKEA